MRFAICDDEQTAIDLLQDQFDLRPELAIEHDAYTSGEALLAAYKNGARYDALFIDMEMGGMNGIDTANAIREMDDEVIVVYVTSYTRYMKQAFGHNVLDFVEKSQLDTDLPHAIDTVARELARRRLSLSIADNKKTVHLYYDEIFYIESVAHYLEFHTKDTVYRSRSSLSQLEKHAHTWHFRPRPQRLPRQSRARPRRERRRHHLARQRHVAHPPRRKI